MPNKKINTIIGPNAEMKVGGAMDVNRWNKPKIMEVNRKVKTEHNTNTFKNNSSTIIPYIGIRKSSKIKNFNLIFLFLNNWTGSFIESINVSFLNKFEENILVGVGTVKSKPKINNDAIFISKFCPVNRIPLWKVKVKIHITIDKA